MRILIVGGVAGGASVAARARRLDAQAEIIIFEREPHISLSSCSLPYYLGGMIEDSDALVLMDAQQLKSWYDIEARVNHEVIAICRKEKKIFVRNLLTGEDYEESYDILVLSPGAPPIRPQTIGGIRAPHVFAIRNLPELLKLKEALDKEGVKDIAVIGGGFIGVEVVENLANAGLVVTLIEAANQIMAPFDYDMVQILHKELIDHGVRLILGDSVQSIEDGQVILSSGKVVNAELVVLAIGVRPETALAQAAGLEIGVTGGIKVNSNYQTSDAHIYAVGDAIEVFHCLSHRPSRLALAGPAQRQARAVADHMKGIPHHHSGVIGSSVVRIFQLNAASTGLNETMARAAGISHAAVYIIPNDKVGLIPGSSPLHFKLLYECPTGRILGAQAIGRGNVDKRIDVIATMIRMNGTLEQLKELELCYSPLFATARDVVNQAALVALNILHGKVRQVPVTRVRELVESKQFLVDVRERGEYESGHLLHARNIPLSELRSRLEEIPRDVPVYLHCRSGQRSYNAYMALANRGYQNLYNISGSYLGICLYEYFNDSTTGRDKIVTQYNFN